MDTPKPEEVRAQVTRLCDAKLIRGKKIQKLLRFIVEEALKGGGPPLTLHYIGESLDDEPLTFEPHSDRWGYPKTRANLAHLRKRLLGHYETEGYRDPVIIKLNPGSYAPVIAVNPVAAAIPNLDPAIERLILRAKTSLDGRTLRGAFRALHYYRQIPIQSDNARQIANVLFIPLAAAAIIPNAAAAIRPFIRETIAQVKALGVAPWECTFAEACAEACYHHRWAKALGLFELAIANSQDEARYFWWYVALLASLGRLPEAIDILDGAVRHFSRTTIATRVDLALLQIMEERFDDAEEMLFGSLDFTSEDNPAIACHLAILYESQDRLEAALTAITKLYPSMPDDTESPPGRRCAANARLAHAAQRHAGVGDGPVGRPRQRLPDGGDSACRQGQARQGVVA